MVYLVVVIKLIVNQSYKVEFSIFLQDRFSKIAIFSLLQGWCPSHPLTTETATLYHIINGQVADGKVNVQNALKIG